MKVTIISTEVLEPASGMHLRNKQSGAIAEGRVFVGKNDSKDNYEEVTEEMYQQWIEETTLHPQPEVE